MRISRNADCPCGSRRRYKNCCGTTHDATASLQSLLIDALRFQTSGNIAMAENLYRQVLAIKPDEPDALNMLGVICFKEVRYREALEFGLQSAEITHWQIPKIIHNLGLTCGRIISGQTNQLRAESLGAFKDWAQAQVKRSSEEPLVSIVIPSYNHAPYLSDTLSSVYAQTYRNLELIVIDDGSQDQSVEFLRKYLSACPWPNKLISRENRGAAATINEGVSLARGKYINILNSDDCFSPQRIQRFVEEIAHRNLDWGFSRVDVLVQGPDNDNVPHSGDLRVQQLITRASHVMGRASNSMAFVEYNPAISTGNLFFRRSLFEQLGGVRDLRYNHDWDFCLRAGSLAEPWYIDEPLYRYRLHGRNTILESRALPLREANDFLRQLLYRNTTAQINANTLSPLAAKNRTLVNGVLLTAGMSVVMPAEVLRAIAQSLAVTEPIELRQGEAGPKVAIVVLGMHRSGTSAMCRTLNLAGAMLPENLRPPKLGNNDRGFWEPEEVIQLNEHLLQRAGATWDKPGAPAALQGQERESFMRAALNMLKSEYGQAPLILLKDPRLCLFADLWDEALRLAGYDPRYVIVVRPPMEVARSLQNRDRMTTDQALALWLSYSRAAETATHQRSRVFVHYHDLLHEWRPQIERVSEKLGLNLDTTSRAEEIDSFLTRDLHRQRDESGVPGTQLGDHCRMLYDQLRSMCRLDDLRGRRILVASIGLTPNGGLLRFARVARILRRQGHELAFLNLGHECDPAFAEFPVYDLDMARKQKWDMTVVAGAGFPAHLMPSLEPLQHQCFGKRIQAILNDQSRHEKFRLAIQHLQPHALLFNNRHWGHVDLVSLNNLPAEWIIGAVDTTVFKPGNGAQSMNGEVRRVGLQGKSLPDVLPLIERFPTIQEWHVFGNLPSNCGIPHALMPRVVLHGILNEPELVTFYRKMDLVIAAEQHAGWCNVAAEAIACGRPVICSPAGTLDFAIDGHNAVVIPEVTTALLQAAINQLLGSSELRAALCHNGPASVAQFNWQEWADAFLSLCSA